ncbi:MAG TPA: SPOR domain-containing protein [Sphingomicrobium sp.]|nr:SPOR domain-containing protein [Sphingomicrobium sp.]
MTDNRSTYDDGQLPWLQPVEDEDEPRGVSARKMLAALGIVVLAVLIVAATFFWLGQRNAAVNGPPELIHAPPGPYKVKPPNPGGLDIAGESETAFETSAGQDTDAKLDLSKVPEQPVAKPPKEQPQPAPRPGFSTAAKTPAKPEPAPEPTPPTVAHGSVIQLGAFANQAQAERAWTALSSRFPSIGGMGKLIVPFSGGIRLRATAASPAEAKQACQTLKAAGENCFVAQ